MFRPSNVLSQILPLICLHGGASLNALLFSYSLNHILLLYGVFIVCLHLLKQPKTAIALVLCQLICTRETFYYSATEVPLAIAMGVLLYATITATEFSQRKLRYTLMFSSLLVGVCAHPYFVFVAGFTLLYSAMKERRLSIIYIPAAMFLGAGIIYSLLYQSGSNEGQLIAKLLSESSSGLWQLKFPLLDFLWLHSGKASSAYIVLELLYIFSLILSIIHKRYLLIGLQLICVVFYVFTSGMMSLDGESSIVLEKSLLPLAFFVAIPMMDQWFSLPKTTQHIVAGTVLVLLFVRVQDISLIGSKRFKKRRLYISEMSHDLQARSTSKFYAKSPALDMGLIGVPWAFSIETLLLSAADSETLPITVYIDDENSQIDESNIAENVFLGPQFDPLVPMSKLNPAYFPLNGIYQEIVRAEDGYRPKH